MITRQITKKHTIRQKDNNKHKQTSEPQNATPVCKTLREKTMNALTTEQDPALAGMLASQIELAAAEPTAMLLIEDHPFFSDGFSNAIKQLFPAVALQCVASAADAMTLLSRQIYDLVFLDVNLPDKSGFDLLDEIGRHRLPQPVVILTGVVSYRIAEQAQRKGAIGAISKSITLPQLHLHCLQLLQGQTVFKPDAMLHCTSGARPSIPTGRELEVLSNLDEGLENAEICARLNVSDSTLRTHLRNLFSKLQVSNRTACLVQARRLGWM
jgi:DNA-binding NarL/FixJ family response regulator